MSRKKVTIIVNEPGWYSFSCGCEEGKISVNKHMEANQSYDFYFNLPDSALKKFDNIDMAVHPKKKRWENKREGQKKTQYRGYVKRGYVSRDSGSGNAGK